MRVLMVSKACVVGAYQRKLEELGSQPDLELRVVVPPYWREAGRVLRLEREHTEGYTLVVEPMAFNGRFHLHFYPWLSRQFRLFRPDVCHIDEEPYNLATFQALRLAERAGSHALFFTWQNLSRRYPPPWSWMEAYVLRKSRHAIAGNQEAAEVLREKGYGGPVAVIPQFGVDPEIYKPSADIRSQSESRWFKIGYVGRLVEEKGVHLLLEAASRLDGEWRLSILGEGPHRPILQRLATRLGVAERVIFLDAVPSSEMAPHLNGLDVLVLPSVSRPNWKEQFGRVLVESMACGTPVIGSSCGEIPNVVDDAGLVFAEGDAVALTRALARVYHDRALREEMAKRGRRRVLDQYTQSRVASSTYQVYQQVLQG